jgi:hypothetical protein
MRSFVRTYDAIVILQNENYAEFYIAIIFPLYFSMPFVWTK